MDSTKSTSAASIGCGSHSTGRAGMPRSPENTSLRVRACLLHPDLGDGRAEDVAGIAQAHPDGRVRLEGLVVFRAAQLPQAGLRLRHGVERRARLSAAAPVVGALGLPLGFLLLDVGRVEQHHAEQVRRRRRHMHRPAEAQRGGARQQPGMVEVGMGEQDEIQAAQIEGQRVAGSCAQASRPPWNMPQSTRKRTCSGLDQEAGTGHFAGGAMECDTHISF